MLNTIIFIHITSPSTGYVHFVEVISDVIVVISIIITFLKCNILRIASLLNVLILNYGP